MPKVTMSMPELGVRSGGFERNKEIYVMSFTSDLQTVNAPRVMDTIAAYNETLPNLMPAVAGEALLKFVLMAVSNTFERIRPEQPASLSGAGILLYPATDPKGLLASHFVILEDDQGKRDLGSMLSGLFGDAQVKSLLDVLQKSVTQPALAALLNAIVSQLPKLLKKNKDDFLFAHSHSGFASDNYGCRPGERVSEYKLGNDRAYCTLRIAVTD